ncbi:MAG TPA: DUF5985 family protein [Pirellulales bacterium]|jgi:membrane protein DedA with SNARE-associated domain|nr:DUF5985 family protein [Pirellulales bacterium]
MVNFLMGATAMACAVAGLFFLRFWRETGDRLFAIFAAAFWLFGLTRFALSLSPTTNVHEFGEHEFYIYLVRLAVFALILLAVLDKNRPRRKAQPTAPE